MPTGAGGSQDGLRKIDALLRRKKLECWQRQPGFPAVNGSSSRRLVALLLRLRAFELRSKLGLQKASAYRALR